MYSEQTRENREKLVVPLFGIVVYPKSRTKLMADKVTGEILLNEMRNAESVSAIGLTVKSGTKLAKDDGDSLLMTDILLSQRLFRE